MLVYFTVNIFTFIVLLFSRTMPDHLKGFVILPLFLVSVVGPGEEEPVEAHPSKEPSLGKKGRGGRDHEWDTTPKCPVSLNYLGWASEY